MRTLRRLVVVAVAVVAVCDADGRRVHVGGPRATGSLASLAGLRWLAGLTGLTNSTVNARPMTDDDERRPVARSAACKTFVRPSLPPPPPLTHHGG